MRGSIFDHIGNLDTLLAVVVGAVLATTGALVAELIQEKLQRRRRERDAARFFGEVMSSIDRILDAAISSKEVGEAWGPVTRRLFRMALREAAVYERNRERLFDICDVTLRTKIHTHMLTTTFPVDAIVDYSDQLNNISDRLLMNSGEIDSEQATHLEARRTAILGSLETALTTLLTEMQETTTLCALLEGIAGIAFAEKLRNAGPAVTTQETQADTGQGAEAMQDIGAENNRPPPLV